MCSVTQSHINRIATPTLCRSELNPAVSADAVLARVQAPACMVDSTIAEAVEMATSTPARIVGVDDMKGSLVPGMDADITVLDRNFSVMLTMVEGRIVHRR